MLAKPNIVPTPEGNIQLEWHTEDADLVVEILDISHAKRSVTYDYYVRDNRGETEGRTNDTDLIWRFIQRIGEEQEICPETIN